MFCQQDLCVAGIFSDLTRSLVQDFPQTLKRTVVYLVSVLVTKSSKDVIYNGYFFGNCKD